MQVQPYNVFDHSAIARDLKRPIIALKAQHIEPFFTEGAINDFSVEEIIDAICTNAVVVERDVAEKDPQYVHPIVYSPIVQLKDDKISFFVYQRTKGVGESRLLGMHSIGIGGHVDWASQYYLEGSEQKEQVRKHILFDTVYNEFTEEIKELQYLNGLNPWTSYESNSTDAAIEQKLAVLKTHPFALNLMHTIRHKPVPVAAIFDRSNEVGRVHLGLVNPIVYTGDRAGVFGSVSTGEDSLVTKGFYDFAQLAETLDTFESWSQELIRHFLNCWNNNPNYEGYFKEMLKERIDHKSASQIKPLGTQDPQTGLNANIDFNVS